MEQIVLGWPKSDATQVLFLEVGDLALYTFEGRLFDR